MAILDFEADYSDGFAILIRNREKIQSLIDENQVIGVDFPQWTKIRSFISKPINKDGSVLNIGCANGLLLRCLQEWCSHKLEPYGIDIRQDLIKKAKELFRSSPKNFIAMDLWELSSGFAELSKYGLPKEYDFIYWHVWDEVEFENEKEIDILKKCLKAVSQNGRLILGFYNSSWKQINEDMKKIEKLEKHGFKFSGILDNGLNDIIAWINK